MKEFNESDDTKSRGGPGELGARRTVAPVTLLKARQERAHLGVGVQHLEGEEVGLGGGGG